MNQKPDTFLLLRLVYGAKDLHTRLLHALKTLQAPKIKWQSRQLSVRAGNDVHRVKDSLNVLTDVII